MCNIHTYIHTSALNLVKKRYINVTLLSPEDTYKYFFSKCFTYIFLLFFFPFFLPSAPLFTFITPAKLGAGGWSPLDTNRNQWLQVDLGSRKQVVAIVTQGRYSSSDWTSKYRLLYSDTQKNWRPYLQDGNIWVSKNLMTGIIMTSHPSFNHLMQFV